MRSCPIERRPSARLQPPVLQVHTWGPGFLASPIRTTGFHQCRSSQAASVSGRQVCKSVLTTIGSPTTAKAASWTNESREIMRAASSVIHKFEKLAGYTLGSLTSSLPEAALIILVLAPSRPMIPLLSFPLSEELRLSVQKHANETVGANKRGSTQAAETAKKAQREHAVQDYHGGPTMKGLMEVASGGNAFLPGTVLNHHTDSLLAHVLESLVKDANRFLSAFTSHAAIHLGTKGSGRNKLYGEPKDIKGYAAMFGVIIGDPNEAQEYVDIEEEAEAEEPEEEEAEEDDDDEPEAVGEVEEVEEEVKMEYPTPDELMKMEAAKREAEAAKKEANREKRMKEKAEELDKQIAEQAAVEEQEKLDAEIAKQLQAEEEDKKKKEAEEDVKKKKKMGGKQVQVPPSAPTVASSGASSLANLGKAVASSIGLVPNVPGKATKLEEKGGTGKKRSVTV
eukprot:5911291-Amphidinium_carterae.1